MKTWYSLLKGKVKTPYLFLALEAITDLRLQTTTHGTLTKYVPLLEASSLIHENKTNCLPHHTAFKIFLKLETYHQEVHKLKNHIFK